MFGQDKTAADDQLTKDFKVCLPSHVEKHLPFKYDDSKAENKQYLKDLCQDGYVIRYSTRRRTPLFIFVHKCTVILSCHTQHRIE